MIKAVIFDIDGVLADSLDANTKFFKDIMHAAGYKHPTRDVISKIFHMNRMDTIKFLSNTDSEDEIQRILQIADEIQYPIRLLRMYPGAKKVVKELSLSYKLAVVTSRMRKTTKDYFNFSSLGKYFDVVVTYENSKKHKPHPEPLLIAAKKLKVKPSEAVYIGDQNSDVQAAKAAEMKVIIYRNKLPNADCLIKSFDEIFRALPRL